MQEQTDVRRLMPLIREFGSLARRRVGVGVTPMEYRRYLDLKRQIGQKFRSPEANRDSEKLGHAQKLNRTRLVVTYASRAELIDSVIENISPVGLRVATPFAAEVGTQFLVRICLEHEGESAEFPAVVVRSISEGAHTLPTTVTGMSLKIGRTSAEQGTRLSEIFAHEIDEQLEQAS